MTEYPWDSIPSNSKPGQYAARSTDADGDYPWLDISWGISPTGNAALIVGYDAGEWNADPLPQFSSIKIQDSKLDRILAIELMDSSSLDMFYRICLDLVDASRKATPSHTRSTCLYRLEKWSSLLKRRSRLLTEEEQKGLIAELLTLKDCVLEAMDETSALSGWTGPESETQDFNYGQIAIEVKSKRKTSQPHVLISSETQLSASSNERLFLRVVELNRDANGKGLTLDDIVEETKISIPNPLQRLHLESKLASIGYFAEDSYEAFSWSIGSIYTYEVKPGFPRIAKEALDYGIDKVSYRLDLDYCADFLASDRAIVSALRRNDE
mgnify:FL=1